MLGSGGRGRGDMRVGMCRDCTVGGGHSGWVRCVFRARRGRKQCDEVKMMEEIPAESGR